MKKLLTFIASFALGAASLQLVSVLYPLPSEAQIPEPDKVMIGHATTIDLLYTVIPVSNLPRNCGFGMTVALIAGQKERGYYRCQPNGKWIRVGDFPDV